MADSVQKPLLRAPVRVGFYDIERTLGKGNFAVVKLARHRITKTEVGVRVCPCTFQLVSPRKLTWATVLPELYNFNALDSPDIHSGPHHTLI